MKSDLTQISIVGAMQVKDIGTRLQIKHSQMILSSWLLLLLTAILQFVVTEIPDWLIYFPFVLSFVFIGLPHGAADHWVLITFDRNRISVATLLRAILPYIALAISYLFLWVIAPEVSFVLFIVITWFHLGPGRSI